MNKYELVVIVSAVAQQSEKEKTIKEVSDVITKFKGKIINSQVWLEKHKFTFRIKGETEGTYYIINFESDPSEIVRVRQLLKLNENVLRSLILKVE